MEEVQQHSATLVEQAELICPVLPVWSLHYVG